MDIVTSKKNSLENTRGNMVLVFHNEYAEYHVHSCLYLFILVHFLLEYKKISRNKQEQTTTNNNEKDIQRTPWFFMPLC